MVNVQNDNNIDKLRGALTEGKTMMETMLGFKLNYYPMSLKKLEEQLNKMFPFGQRQIAPHVSILMGLYLGEVIVRNLKRGNPRWNDFKENPFNASITFEVPNDDLHINESIEVQVLPMVRLDKFINEDRTDTIYGYYCMLQDMVNKRIKMHTDGEWSPTSRGYTYRTTAIPKEDILNREKEN
jgi:hypothetical protein